MSKQSHFYGAFQHVWADHGLSRTITGENTWLGGVRICHKSESSSKKINFLAQTIYFAQLCSLFP